MIDFLVELIFVRIVLVFKVGVIYFVIVLLVLMGMYKMIRLVFFIVIVVFSE